MTRHASSTKIPCSVFLEIRKTIHAKGTKILQAVFTAVWDSPLMICILRLRFAFPDHATDPVFDIAGTREVKGDPPPNYDSYKSCLNFYEKENYIAYLNNADSLLGIN